MSLNFKYLIFDWGGVFTHGHLLKDFSANLSVKCEKSKEEIEKVFRELEFPYETGKVSPAEFWENFRNKLGVKMAAREIQNMFLNSYVVNFPMLEYAKELKKKYKLILLTNSYEDMFDF
ncbi:MAG: hypothetical protein AAB933_00735 [Patescibacteria group bacterium]|mgnify:FL=1